PKPKPATLPIRSITTLARCPAQRRGRNWANGDAEDYSHRGSRYNLRVSVYTQGVVLYHLQPDPHLAAGHCRHDRRGSSRRAGTQYQGREALRLAPVTAT